MRRLIILRVGEPEPDDLIEVQEAARILRISRSSVYNAIRRGVLKSYIREFDLQMGVRRRFVSRTEVERLARFRPQLSEQE